MEISFKTYLHEDVLFLTIIHLTNFQLNIIHSIYGTLETNHIRKHKIQRGQRLFAS